MVSDVVVSERKVCVREEVSVMDAKHVIVINGAARAGKDTFVHEFSKIYYACNYSMVERVKMIAELCGWDADHKTERDRKFLSDLKMLTTSYSDMSYMDVSRHIHTFLYEQNLDNFMFIHSREPSDIRRLVADFNAIAILVKRPDVAPIQSNIADKSVNDYHGYRVVINNDGNIGRLNEKAYAFGQLFNESSKIVQLYYGGANDYFTF